MSGQFVVHNAFVFVLGKLITSRQARRPFIPSHYQRPPPPPEHQSLPSQLPPPTSLDIMDLPIIFADDNQVLTDDYTVQKTANEIKHGVPAPARPPSTPALPPPTPSPTISNPVGKLVILNKQPINVSIPSQHSTPTLRVSSFSNIFFYYPYANMCFSFQSVNCNHPYQRQATRARQHQLHKNTQRSSYLVPVSVTVCLQQK